MVKDYSDGQTLVYGVIGDPVEHSFSPQIQNTFAYETGKNIMYVPFHVKNDCLGDAIKGAHSLNIRGLNVTVPHKKEVMAHLNGIDNRAEQIGAVNTLKYTEDGYVGYNTDFIGILYSLKNKGVEIKDKTVILLGAGGCACAAAVMALSEGAERLVIANRTQENALKLKEHILKFYNADIIVSDMSLKGDFGKCDIAINATVLGFGKNAGINPIPNTDDYSRLGIEACFDAVYTPWKTKFLEDAESLGITAVNGFDMLVYQAAAAQEIWFDVKYEMSFLERIRQELEQYYTNEQIGKTAHNHGLCPKLQAFKKA